MPGPLPDPDSQRSAENRRRSVPTTNLPLGGFEGDTPEPSIDLDGLALDLYREAWRSPAAAAWHVAHRQLVTEWALTKASVLASRAKGDSPPGTDLARANGIEDRLFMSPLSMAKGRAKIVDDAPDASERSDSDGRSELPDGVREKLAEMGVI